MNQLLENRKCQCLSLTIVQCAYHWWWTWCNEVKVIVIFRVIFRVIDVFLLLRLNICRVGLMVWTTDH